MEIFTKNWFAAILISLLALSIYAPTISYEFVLDDKIVLTENEYTKEGIKGIPKILGADTFTGFFGEQKDLLPGARYRPLSLVTFALETELFGINSTVHHIGNILLYILCCIILFFTLKTIFANEGQLPLTIFALMASILFVAHPIHVEAVANIKGRDEIMALLFSLLTLKWAHNYFESNHWKHPIIIGFAYLMALLSKENSITFLAIIPFSLLLFSKGKPRHWGGLALSLILPTMIYFGMRYNAVGYIFNSVEASNLMNNPFINMDGHQKYATIFHTLLLYLKLGFFPHPLTHDYYPFHIPTMRWSDVTPIISLVIYSVIGIGSMLLIKRQKIVSWTIFFYIATISIVSNLFVNVGTFMNERFLFMPSVGLMVLLTYFLASLYNSDKSVLRYLAVGLFLLLATGYTTKSISRVPDWNNSLTLNKSAVKISKNSARANLFMGTTYFNQYKESQNNTEKAILLQSADQYITRSFELYPKYGNAAHMMAGIAAEKYRSDKNLTELLKTFRQVAIQRPDTPFLHTYFEYLNTSAVGSELINFYFLMGYDELHRQQKNSAWAAKYLLYAFQLNENDRNVNLALNEVYLALNRPKEAQYYRTKATSIQ